MRAIDRWRRLTRDEQALAVRAAVSVAAMSLGMRTLGIKRMLRAAENTEKRAAEGAQCAELVLAVERAGRYVPGATCLAQSLALTRMLRTRGVEAETKIGVETADGFHAHAWVEVAGVAITAAAGRPLLSPER